MAEFQVAWPFSKLESENLDEFIERWAAWLSAAATGKLGHPSTLPERPLGNTWRGAEPMVAVKVVPGRERGPGDGSQRFTPVKRPPATCLAASVWSRRILPCFDTLGKVSMSTSRP